MGTSIKFLYALAITVCISMWTYAVPSKIRAVLNGSPSTSITIVFDTSFSGEYDVETNPKLYYGTGFSAVNSYASASATPTSVNTRSEMRNNIVRLNNLNPGTKYYFKIKDSKGSTDVYHFETISDQLTDRLSLIAGGDSRSNRSVRVNANKAVAKLKPHAVMFDGDMTDQGTPTQWKNWLEDWQYTIDNAKRIIPIMPARGNHESHDNELIELFGSPANVYYTNTLGGGLVKIYTLNSEKAINAYGAQTTWLLNELSSSGDDPIYNFAQYHKPMRPHISSKAEGVAQYAYWSNIFYTYGFDVIVEGDAHTSKITHPVSPCTGGYNCDEGFKRDDVNGTVFIGEGCWGAPLRADDDTKTWTRNSGMYNQFKLIFIGLDGIEIRTVLVDNETQIGEVNINNRFSLPPNQNIWTTGDVTNIKNRKNASIPVANLISPPDNATLYNTNPIVFYANATNANGSIDKVSFYVNGTLVNQDTSYPYQYTYNPPNYGPYLVHIIATDNQGLTSCMDMSNINLINSSTIINTAKVNSTTDDAEEYSTGYVDLFNWDLDLGYSSYVCGLRFQNINVPPKAIITNANIRFIADEVKSIPTTLEIFAHDNSFSPTFFIMNKDISNRPKTTASVSWAVDNWTQVGASGSAQTTPNLKSVVQSLVNRPDWDLSSPMTFIFNGNGYRVSETVDGDINNAPVLTVTYTTAQVPPSVIFINQEDTIVCDVNDQISLKAVALLPSSTMSQIQFKVGNNVIGNSSMNPAQINAPTSSPGIYTIKAIVTDNLGMTGEDDLIINVIGDICDSAPTGLALSNQTTQRTTLSWNQVSPSTVYDIEYKKSSSNIWTSINNGTSEMAILTDLDPVTSYQVRICSKCDTGIAKCTNIKTFTTSGICNANETTISTWEISTNSNSSIVHWDIGVDATYKVFYKKSGDNSWSSHCVVHPMVLLYGLEPCKTYQWQVQLVCNDYETCDDASASGFKTPIKTLTTAGCKTNLSNANLVEQPLEISGLQAFPSPMLNNLNVEFELNTTHTTRIEIIDLNGSVVDFKEVEGTGFKSVNFNVSTLASGTYMVLVDNGAKQKSYKVVK